MKKNIFLILSLLLLFSACTTQVDNISEFQSSEVNGEGLESFSHTESSEEDVSYISDIITENESASDSQSDEEEVDIYFTYKNEEKVISSEHREFVSSLLLSDGWNDGASDCESDFTIKIRNDEFVYHSECGAVNDEAKVRSKNLNDSERARLNDILAETFEAYKDALAESSEEPEPDPEQLRGHGNPIQLTHKTPENLNCCYDSQNYNNSEITPIYVRMVDVDRLFVRVGDKAMISSGHDDDGHIEQAGLKLWICTESGKKIDYVYTNSAGIAKFELTEGKYNIYFEGDGTWASKYCGTIHADSKYNGYLFGSGYCNEYALLTYHDIYDDFKVRVVDSETKEPIKDAKVKVSNDVVYTDKNGYAVFKPLPHYVSGRGTVFSVDCEKEGYVANYSTDSDLYNSYVEVEMEAVKIYDFTITVLDYKTKAPVSGVWVAYTSSHSTEGTEFNNKKTGDDGIISGRVSSEEFSEGFYYVYIKYTHEYTLEDGSTVEYTAEYTVHINANRLNRTVYIEHFYRDFIFRTQ